MGYFWNLQSNFPAKQILTYTFLGSFLLIFTNLQWSPPAACWKHICAANQPTLTCIEPALILIKQSIYTLLGLQAIPGFRQWVGNYRALGNNIGTGHTTHNTCSTKLAVQNLQYKICSIKFAVQNYSSKFAVQNLHYKIAVHNFQYKIAVQNLQYKIRSTKLQFKIYSTKLKNYICGANCKLCSTKFFSTKLLLKICSMYTADSQNLSRVSDILRTALD